MEMYLDFFKPLLDIFLLFFPKEGILTVVLTMGITEFLKQVIKSYKGVRSLKDWEIRGLAMVIAVFFSSIILVNFDIQSQLIYGLFYGICTPVAYMIGKKYVISKYYPDINNILSGQGEDDVWIKN